ncbi:unnamed protein product, partial [Cladocopium goreaui]
MPEPEADAYTVELRPDGPDPKHLQVVSSEGRPSCFWKQLTCPPSQSQVYIPELYESVAQVCVALIHDFKPRQLVTLAGSFAKAQVKHDALFKCMSKHVAKNVEDFQREDLQDLFNAFQALGVSKNEVQRALDEQEKGPAAPLSLRTFLLI